MRLILSAPIRRAAAVLLAVFLPLGAAAAPPTHSSTGEACIRSGEERREGRDARTGERLSCLFDYCTHCTTSGGRVDCNTLRTEYSNARECRPVRRVLPGLLRPQAPGGGVLAP